ncbi:MAG TPA: hypothetical protein PKY81_00505 [bacterium]|mgnify:CR=1 FL=1|nr:hypothetical protein [bacterium]
MENKIKNIFILNAVLWIFCLIMYIALVSPGDPENMENSISYNLLFIQIALSFTGLSAAFILWEDISQFFKTMFLPSFSIFYSILTSVILMIYLLSGMLDFSGNKSGIEFFVNAFVFVLILQPVIFLISRQNDKHSLIKGTFLIIIGMAGIVLFLIGGQRIPGLLVLETANGVVGGDANIQGKDIMFLSLTSFFVVIAGTLETQKYAQKTKKKF